MLPLHHACRSSTPPEPQQSNRRPLHAVEAGDLNQTDLPAALSFMIGRACWRSDHDTMTRRLLLTLFPSLLASLAVACGSDDNPTAPTEVTGSAPFSTTDLVVGTGAEASAGQRISVNYTGWLYSDTAAGNKGRQFDSSAGRGTYSLTLGAGQVIRGWDQGIPGMRAGGRRRIVIPPELAYGASGQGTIPPNATLLFEVDLVSVQ